MTIITEERVCIDCKIVLSTPVEVSSNAEIFTIQGMNGPVCLKYPVCLNYINDTNVGTILL